MLSASNCLARSMWRVAIIVLSFTPAVGAQPGPRQAGDSIAPRLVVGPNHRVSPVPPSGERNESWVSASLTDSLFLVGSSHTGLSGGCATYISRDGGNLWTEARLPGAADGRCFDAMTTAGPDGRMYVLYTVSPTQPRFPTGTVRIWSTADRGKTWTGPADIYTPVGPDHPRLIVDNTTGPRRGTVYVAWNEGGDSFLRTKYFIFVSASTDNGRSFPQPNIITIGSGGKLVITEPLVLSDGTLILTYYQYYQPLSNPKNDHQPIWFVTSTDGAKTLSDPQKVFEVGSSGWRGRLRDFGRAFTLPIFTADANQSSPHRDRIYVTWDDVSSGQSDIWLSSTDDRGKTWSPKKRVNDNPPPAAGSPRDHRSAPVVAVNGRGVVGVAWYDRREDPAKRCWKQYFAASFDGGASFAPNIAVSSVPSCPGPGKQGSPVVQVSNLATMASDDTVPSDEEFAKMNERDKQRWERLVIERQAMREENTETGAARLKIVFDPSRNIWPGHYSGLTADLRGSFHALFADRRTRIRPDSVVQEMFTARVDLASPSAAPEPPLIDADVTRDVQVLTAMPEFDEATSTTRMEVQLRNVSGRTIYGPIRLTLKPVLGANGQPTAEIVDAGSSGAKKGTPIFLDFSKSLGGGGKLEPLGTSEIQRLTIKTKSETGLDGLIDFEVSGRVAK